MRRRRIDMLSDDIKDALRSEAKGLLGTIVKLFLSKIVEIIIKALTKSNWVDLSEDELGI